ncbi:hypothetical protein ANCCAN_07991 [Ancylostoma caninum]|uniref:Uncharacterized protein n=1 Tax=Ancylostoma caninum TaxID=29170 RepID=A0A368GSK1_ANCCA|nr:hypothetical protein ANCCAN_07991 [Ancylostoma caninum]
MWYFRLADSNDKVKMVSVSLASSMNDLCDNVSEPRSRTEAARRRLSQAIRLSRPRAHSVQPIRLGTTKPVFDTNPERPYTAFDLSNGFKPSKTFFSDSCPLGRVVEEAETPPSDNSATREHSIKTIQSIDETEVPEIFKKELEGDGNDK